MRVNESTFVTKLNMIMEDYKNDKISFPWEARSISEHGNEITFQLYLNTIANINSLPHHATKYKDVDLSEWKVPTCFKPLIMPSRITVDNSSDAVNLLDTNKEHTYDNKKKIDGKNVMAPDMSYQAFMKVNHSLRRIYRKDESSWFHDVKSLRAAKLLGDVLDRVAHEELTPNYDCIPLQLQIQFYDNETYVFNIYTVAERYMRKHIAQELGGLAKKEG